MIIFLIGSYASSSNDEWRMGGGNLKNQRITYKDIEELYVRWITKTPTEKGYKYPHIIADEERVYILSPTFIMALSTKTGGILWSRRVDLTDWYIYPPAVAGDTIFVPSFNELMALDAEDGSLVWRVVMDNSSPTAYNGYFMSKIAVARGKVLGVFRDFHGGHRFVAFNAKSGRVVWNVTVGWVAGSDYVVIDDVIYYSDGSPQIKTISLKDGSKGAVSYIFPAGIYVRAAVGDDIILNYDIGKRYLNVIVFDLDSNKTVMNITVVPGVYRVAVRESMLGDTIYLAIGGKIKAYSVSGKTKWEAMMPEGGRVIDIAVAKDQICVLVDGEEGDYLVLLNKTGFITELRDLPKNSYEIITTKGAIYILFMNGEIRSYGTPESSFIFYVTAILRSLRGRGKYFFISSLSILFASLGFKLKPKKKGRGGEALRED